MRLAFVIRRLGQSGAEAAAVADALRIFEAESRATHQRDPSHPIYHIVTGQNASRDQTADPTRFLVSVAGGGDTVAALNAAGVTDRFTYVSTAGGAFLEWLEGKALPGVEALKT